MEASGRFYSIRPPSTRFGPNRTGRGSPGRQRLHGRQAFLRGGLQDDYLRYSANHCENSEGWYNKKRYYLSWWADVLRGVNLRDLDTEQHVFPALKHWSGRAHAIAVLKHLISWMRDPEHGPAPELRLVGEEGRCVIDYQPKSRIKARQITKARWFPYENWLTVRPHLSAWQQEAGDVLAATGWHSTELLAFVCNEGEAGRIEEPPGGAMLLGTAFAMSNGERKVEVTFPSRAKVLVTRHKGGHIHKTLASLEVAKIAERLQQRGILDLNRLTNKLAWLCGKKDCDVATTDRTRPYPGASIRPSLQERSGTRWRPGSSTPAYCCRSSRPSSATCHPRQRRSSMRRSARPKTLCSANCSRRKFQS